MKTKTSVITILALLSIAAASVPSYKYYFEDIRVIETVTRRQLTVDEVMEILDRQPNIKSVSIPINPRIKYFTEDLAYPQNESRYQLTKKEWADLQAFCREELKKSFAVEEVKAHWVSIVGGTPPFGLKVSKE